MIAVKHPYDDNKGIKIYLIIILNLEVDISFFDNYLIVAQQFNFRFVQINPEEVTTTMSQYANPDESH